MTRPATSTHDRGTAERALRWVGDLDHPFYSDERHRYVWYEASAIAFQLLFIGSYFANGFVLLVAGANALPYALPLFVPTMAAAVVFQSYLKTHSAEYWPGRNDLRRRRGQLAIAAGIVVIAGILRATYDLQTRSSGGFTSSAIIGVLAGALLGVLFIVVKSRQSTT